MDFVQELLPHVFQYATHSIAVNFMHSHDDWERDDLFHLPLDKLYAFCAERCHVTLYSFRLRSLRIYCIYIKDAGMSPVKPVIIFGNKDFASLAHFYLTEDSDFEVAAFSISSSFLNDGESTLRENLW